MKQSRLFSIMLMLTAILAIAGCASMSMDQGPAGDQAIAQDVQERLRADPVTARHVIGVQVRDAVVTLQGLVPDAAVRLRADAIARETQGVTSVVDALAPKN
jgi:osmotically-inducible protein OsmY